MSGCATPQLAELSRLYPLTEPVGLGTSQGGHDSGKAPGGLFPVSALIADVPFLAQDDFQCGPAALAMLARHAGRQVLPDELTAQVYVPGRRGSFQIEMLAAARRQSLLAYPLRPRLEDLLREVASGNPVLVFQNLSLAAFPIWHYAVVIGFDRQRNTMLLHSGVTERLEMSIATFERTWSRGDHWSMVALPPSRLPATAQAESFAVAAAALERVQPAAAHSAYTAALQAWPGQRTALLGLGNAAYALGHKDQAALHFESATRQHADFAEAWNNLAQVRREQGRLTEAAQASDQAVRLGGARIERYRSLQAQIRQQIEQQAKEKISVVDGSSLGLA